MPDSLSGTKAFPVTLYKPQPDTLLSRGAPRWEENADKGSNRGGTCTPFCPGLETLKRPKTPDSRMSPILMGGACLAGGVRGV